ncbi:MAG: DNA adenine methylase, partial [Promethearchaeota archaeon]
MPNKNNEQYREYIITTRYRGSKNKVIPLIYQVIKDLKFNTVLDAFGGTGAVSYLFKRLNKIVVFNEHLKFNYIIGRALIENSVTILEEEDIKRILQERDYSTYPHFIEESFKDVYYTDKENRELDMILANIRDLDKNYDGGDAGKIHKPYLKDCAYWALFQACIIKRPFSLFHRKNLYIRLNKVKRSFGNKVTWERPIKGYIRKFASELNGYIISTGLPSYSSLYDISGAPLTPKMFLNEKDKIIERNNSLYIHHTEADQYLRIPKGLFDQINMENFDLVYIDPPYIPRKGENIVYRDVY